jgi:small subunit ribosomal protein S17e
MGRIKTTPVKRVTKAIFDKYSDEFTDDYTENKKVVQSHATFYSKKLRNIVSGYVTRLKKTEDKF